MTQRRSGALLAFALLCGVVLLAATTSSARTTATAKSSAVPSWCGPKKITLGLTDGFGGNSWRLVTTASARNEASKCPSVTSLSYADGQGNTQKAISDIQGMVAKGIKAIVVFPDAGKAILPALTSAYKAGVVTVPYRVTPGGKAGVELQRLRRHPLRPGGRELGQVDPPGPAEGRQRAHAQRPAGQQPGHRGEQGAPQDPRPLGQVQVHRRAAVRGDELGPGAVAEGSLGRHRQVPEDRRDRVGLRPVAGRRPAGVQQERSHDPGARDL